MPLGPVDEAGLNAYRASGPYVDADHVEVRRQAATLAASAESEFELVAACFTFVRDQIRHSADFKLNPVTCRASDVLRYGTGYCYAKAHLLAALLRANGIPAGLCYQRLSVGDEGPPYCLHGLNAVYLRDFGWYRIDARGNKPGVAAEFSPPHERLAFPVRAPEECNLPGIWAEPLPVVVEVLSRHDDYAEVLVNLPDLAAGEALPGLHSPR